MRPAPVPAIRGRKPMKTFGPRMSKTQRTAQIVRRIAVSMSHPQRIWVDSRDRDLALLTSFALRAGPMPTEGRGRGERGGPRWYCAPDLGDRGRGRSDGYLSLIHISEPTRLGMISYA